MRFGLGFGVNRGGGAGGAGPFDPRSLYANGEQGYILDASDFSSMFQDAAGTVPVTATGQPVGRMLDVSGNGYIFTQTTDANRPTLMQDAGGNYYLSSDGVSKRLVSTTAVTLSGSAKVTVMVGIRFTASVFYTCLSQPDLDGRIALQRSDSNVNRLGTKRTGSTGEVAQQVETIANGTNAVLAASVDYAIANTANAAQFYINGVAGTDTSIGSGSAMSAVGNLQTTILSEPNGSSSLNGRLYYMVVRGGAWTSDELDNCTAYVNGKTGAF